MRIFLISLIAVLVFAAPAMAGDTHTVDVELTINPFIDFITNNAGPLTCTIDAFAEYDAATDIGDVDYDLTTNHDWQVTGLILDGVQGGQTAADWNAAWTLSVNAVTLDEVGADIVDTGSAGDNDAGALWEVLLTVPWPEAEKTPDCTIELTVSMV